MKTPQLRTLLGSLCLGSQGDLGPYTSYTNKSGVIWFLKAWLRDPRSPAQVKHRNRIRACALSWNNADPQTRRDYQLVTARLTIYINGYNLWISLSMNQLAIDCVNTLRHQSQINFPLPPPN